MTAAPVAEKMFPPFEDDLFFSLIAKLEGALRFQSRAPRVFWDDVRKHESREWCEKDRELLIRLFLDDPVTVETLEALVADDNGQFAADDLRRFELCLDSLYRVMRAYANFVHVGD